MCIYRKKQYVVGLNLSSFRDPLGVLECISLDKGGPTIDSNSSGAFLGLRLKLNDGDKAMTE